VGNGPSLDDTKLYELGGQYITFGSNKIYQYPFTPNYYTCFDRDMLHDCIPWLMDNRNYQPDAIFIPRDVPLGGSTGLNVSYTLGFSTDASEGVYIAGTVTMVNLQLAYYMGFKTALTVGLDHKYEKTGNDGKPGSKFIAEGKDPDHFVGEGAGYYFTPGRMYNRPELDNVARLSYPMALRYWEQDGRRIINISAETALDVFERDSEENWL
jgi:hypothetical protein